MRKILLLTVAAILAAGPSYAATTTTSGQTIDIAVGTSPKQGPVAVTGFSKFSNKVTASISSNGSQYAIIAVHANGDKEYGTASTDGKIFWTPHTVGNAVTAVTNSDTTQFTSWSSL